ncbi:hypothetical protein ACLKA7_000553 [Drosophila subpalustris]
MNLCRLLTILFTLSLASAWGRPARMEDAGEQQSLPGVPAAQLPSADPSLMSSLAEISDMGSQHAEGGEARSRRFLWGGIWAGPYWPRHYGYYGYYYRPWGYRYWW